MRRFATTLICLALLAAACGTDDTAADDDPTSEETASPEETAEETTEPTDEKTESAEPSESGETSGSQSASDEQEAAGDLDLGADTVRIGVLMPFSGPIGFLGTFVANSVQVEVDRINDAGGLGGATLEVVERDTELNPQLAVQGAQELAGDDSVGLIIGPAFTGFFNATKQIFEETSTPNCQMAVAAAGVLEGTEFAFRNQDPDQFRVPRMLDYLADQGIESVGIVYENDDTGQGYAETIPDLAAERGMEFIGFQATRPDDQTHRPQVEAVQSAEAILVSNNSTNAAKTAAAAEEIGYEGQLFGFSGLQGFTYVEGAGAAADGTVFAANYLGYFTQTPAEEWPPAYRDHVQSVIEQYGETEGPQSGVTQYNGTALSADCVVLWAEAVRDAGSLEPTAVVEAWEGLDIPAEEMPSFVDAEFSEEDHETYGEDDLFIYEWTQAGEGEWILEELAGPDRE